MSTLIANAFLAAVFASQSSVTSDMKPAWNILPTEVETVPSLNDSRDIKQREVIYFDAPPRPYDAVIRR